MKRRKIIIIILLLVSAILGIIYKQAPQEHLKEKSQDTSVDKPISFAIVTDLHYLSSKLTDNGGFFTKMIDHADGKNMYYIEEITDAFVDQVIRLKPEYLILSGDLTFNGEKQSHLELAEKLSKIRNSDIEILTIPGNHDIERSSAAKFIGDGYQFVPTISKKEFQGIYGLDNLQLSLQKDDNSLSYVYKSRSDLWFLMLDSNANRDNSLSDETLEWVEQVLKTAQKNHAKIIAVSHQNLLPHNPQFSNGFLISQADKLRELYQKYGVLINFSGHIHIQHIEQGQVPEIVTSALSVSPHQFSLVKYDGKKLNYQTQALSLEEWAKWKGYSDKYLLNFSTYSRKFMEEIGAKKAEEGLDKEKLLDQEVALLRETFGQLNADYFAGNQVDLNDYNQGLNLWKQQSSTFMKNYIDTIIKENQSSHHDFFMDIKDSNNIYRKTNKNAK
ncbi:metallophosphoesterase [Streptococcus sp. 20-1249]|uniref:metallophosphoesterase n=1 Tax=Streptococcus hepaticus TaxID=3349163 RepID=UPI0037481E8C